MFRLRSSFPSSTSKIPTVYRSLPPASTIPFQYLSTETETQSSDESKLKKIPGDRPGCHRNMRRKFFVDAVVDKIMNQSLGHPFQMWTKTRAEWYRILKTKNGCDAFLNSKFLNQLRSGIRNEDLEATKKFGSQKVCLGRTFDEHKRIKMNLYFFKYKSLAEEAERERELAEEQGLRQLELGSAVDFPPGDVSLVTEEKQANVLEQEEAGDVNDENCPEQGEASDVKDENFEKET